MESRKTAGPESGAGVALTEVGSRGSDEDWRLQLKPGRGSRFGRSTLPICAPGPDTRARHRSSVNVGTRPLHLLLCARAVSRIPLSSDTREKQMVLHPWGMCPGKPLRGKAAQRVPALAGVHRVAPPSRLPRP